MKYFLKFSFFAFIFFACRGGTEKPRYLFVTEIVDGNTVKVGNQEVDLLGVSNTEEGRKYLQNEVLQKEITYQFDSQREKVGQGTPLYILTKSGKSINREMLENGIAELTTKGVYDSLTVYQSYANGTAILEEAEAEKPVAEIEKPGRIRNFKDAVREREKSVFLVSNRNKAGRQTSIGTGFFISETGIALSNYHVFEGGESWAAKMGDGGYLDVTDILYASEENDFIIFQVELEGRNIVPIPLFDGKVEKGEEIFVLGNPNGLESSLTRGVVSAIRQDLYDIKDLIQIDAAISPGSSGSPVMTMDGTAIGIATLKKTDCENCNFAVNIKLIREVIEYSE